MIPFALFWGAATFVGYVVAGFPAFVVALARLRPRPVAAADIAPPVSVIIAAHDEAGVIATKLANLLASDYPGTLQVVVASDGSSDGTVAEARRFADPRVEVLDLPRVGKARALNAAVARAQGSVLVFTDANSMLAPTSLAALVRPLADPAVGGVAGNQVYAADGHDGLGERAHWRLDRLLKQAESRVGNAISATGALYAIRSELFEPVIEGVTDDFYTSTGVIARGRRLVFAVDAIATEEVASDGGKEFRRKQRVMTRGLWSLRARRELLDPRRTGFYAIELWTYKVARRLLAVPLVVMTLSAPFLWRRGRLYRAATIAQGGFWALAVGGVLAPRRRIGRHPLCALPAFAAAGMWASVRALVNVATGRSITVWETVREPAEEHAA